MRVLIVGGGGREHALAWKIRQSPLCTDLLCTPGNGGITAIADCYGFAPEDVGGLAKFAWSERPDLVVVGPEAPLVGGLADELRQIGIPVFGPTAAAAAIEGSKAYARDLMARAGVRQPAYACFRDLGAATRYLEERDTAGAAGVVVKASGLAAGKGAVVCGSLTEAREMARAMLVERQFGEASAEIVIEERLEGEEASLLILTDGRNVIPCLPAQDYKRAYDEDRGPNTGGMGSYAPAPVITPALYEDALESIIHPVLQELERDGHPFQGCLYAGVMKTASGLQVIEFNCRFGDPETQAVLPLLESDLLELLAAAATRDLAGIEARWSSRKAVSVVMSSGGYPGKYETGKRIDGLSDAAGVPGVTIFHAGTRREGERCVTAGSRVLNVTAVRPSFAEARSAAYEALGQIHFEGAQYRTDIAARVA